MKFFYTENLVTTDLKTGVLPWEFVPTENITPQIRKVKEDRQQWYQNPATKHYFYTGIEPMHTGMRVSKSNPPYRIWCFVADYDLPISDERLNEAIAAMPIKPAWIETSLGGNRRLIWILSKPFMVDDYDFTVCVLQNAKKWLKLDLLPGLDEPAFETVTRLYALGGPWKETGHGPIPDKEAISFFVECGRQFRFKAPDGPCVPLDVAWAQIQKLFPGVEWPGDFVVGSQGPSFWVPGSTSPNSAIVKEDGLFTFAGHAEHPFYGWGKILGEDFIKDFKKTAISKATDDIWWDNKYYWRRINKVYSPCSPEEQQIWWEVDCRVTTKPEEGGPSQMKIVRNHVHCQQRIHGAAPFVYRQPGLMNYNGKRILNTYNGKLMEPATGKQEWGAKGNFPFISKLLENFFNDLNGKQLAWFISWLQYFYVNAAAHTPEPGQNIFLMGGVGIGKTLVNRYIVGAIMGGFSDASGFLVAGDKFNAHLFENGVWSLDDDSPTNSPYAATHMATRLKKTTANAEHQSEEKFMRSVLVEWLGRIIITANTDSASARILGPMDNGVMDKTTILRCVQTPQFPYPSRPEIRRLLEKELPYFLRWVIDFQRPDYILTDGRFGIAAIQDKELLNMAHQSSPIASFKEVLIYTLNQYFRNHQDEKVWTGTAHELYREITSDVANEYAMRGTKPERANQYLEQIQKEGVIKCENTTDRVGQRVWTFHRDTTIPGSITPAVDLPPNDNSFQK